MVNNTACLGVASRVGLGSSYGKKKNGFLFVCLFVCYHMQWWMLTGLLWWGFVIHTNTESLHPVPETNRLYVHSLSAEKESSASGSESPYRPGPRARPSPAPLTTLSLFSGSVVDTALPHSSAGKEATAPQAPLSTEFPRHGYGSGLPFSSPGDLPNPGIKLASPVSPALAGKFFTQWHHLGGPIMILKTRSWFSAKISGIEIGSMTPNGNLDSGDKVYKNFQKILVAKMKAR